MFGFTRFSLANADAITEFLFGASVVRFAIICPNARARANKLGNQWLRNEVYGNAFCKGNDRLPEQPRAFLQIVWLRRSRTYFSSTFVICISSFLRHLDFAIRHSTPSSHARRARRSSPAGCRSTSSASSSRRWGTCSRPSRCGGIALVSLPVVVAQPVAGVVGDVELAVRVGRPGSGGRSCRASRSRGRCASFWATWKSIVQGRRAAVERLHRPRRTLARSLPVEVLRQDARPRGRCSPACRGACGPCRPGSRAFAGGRPVPAARPSVFQLCMPPQQISPSAASRSPWSSAIVAGLAEGLGDPLLVALGVLRPVADAAGRVDPHHAVRPHAQLAQPLGDAAALADLLEELACARPRSPIAEPPPVGGQTGATTEPITRFRERTLSARRFELVVARRRC